MYFFDEVDYKLRPSSYKELMNIRISDIEQQEEVYWIGTSQGLFKMNDKKLEKISISDGLLSDNINDLMIGSDGRLWIATVKGLSVYDGQSFVNITQKENLLSNNINGVFEDDQHNIWIATVKGISILTSKNQNFKQVAPIINVFQNEESFDYEVISYSNANNLFTQYQINDQPWKISTTNPLDFKNFKEGKYTFQLRSKKPKSDWTYSKIYTFHVRVPLHQKTGFIVFVVILVALLIISLIFFQLKKSNKTNRLLTQSLQKQKELEVKLTTVRENIAEDFHDDLGNKLASITILTDMLSNKVTSKESKGIVDQILNHSDSLYKGTKDFIWTLKKESDQIEEMVTYLSDFGEDFFQQLNIQFRIEKCIESDVKLPYYWSRHLILIFKEAMTNAAKHSQCTETVIEFNFRKNHLKIVFQDNGIGFAQEEISNQNGLRNMVDRAAKIGGELHCSSSNNGTEIIFTGNVYPE
jgi:signal transduction histidine kinase